MKIKKIISTFLAVLMLASACTIAVGAEDTAKKEYQYRTSSTKSLMKKNTDTSSNGFLDEYLYKTGEYETQDEDGNTVTDTIDSPEEKLSVMDYRYGEGDYELYVDAYSGEVAVRCISTGETLFTNPYNMGESKASSKDGLTKEELLSQLVVDFTNIATGDKDTYYSYTWASLRNQIEVSNIKGGIRVEYTIGRQETRSLLPRIIEASAMEEIIATIEANVNDAIESGKVADKSDVSALKSLLSNFKSYYIKYTTADADNSIINAYPIVEKMDIYVLDDADLSETQLGKLEGLMKDYCPEYTFEDLDEDHAKVEYEESTTASALFKMALEYTLDDDGLVVRLPANGIRFNETSYRLNYIDILPWMGAGANPNSGYTFFPDGSGAIFDFEEIAAMEGNKVVTGKVYGEDYAYHEINSKFEEIIRYPVYGVVESEKDGDSETRRGFVAIVEEGDSLMELTTYHGGQICEFNTIKMTVYPRPTDTYNIADSISVGSNSEWTVVSDRKYTESYKVRYIMLSDKESTNETTETFECSYVGMAAAYRDYLEDNGTLTRLTDADIKEDIPLYIETFGAAETVKRFLSVPINVMTPLTSFSDIITMYDSLAAEDVGITNVNFILTGYTKGGMTGETMPYRLKWENAVEDGTDFDALSEYASAKGFGLYPDFDFVFSSNDKMFDGLSLNKHAAKTIDNRYTSKREYSATKHTYITNYELAISSAYFSHFYEKFIPKYSKLDPMGISVSTLGSYLNSDFDEDEPYNRADSQEFTVQAFDYINENLPNTKIMTSAANAYSWKYVDHITDIAFDSSRYAEASAAVPFLGMVLHGYVELASTAINMEGNLDYAFLKTLESGASLKFILSYQNTEILKNYEDLSRYYSVRYDIWFDDMVSMYTELNSLLKGVQTSAIIDHKFIDGVRVPDDDELEADALAALEAEIAAEKAEKDALEFTENELILEAKDALEYGTDYVVAVADSLAIYLSQACTQLNDLLVDLDVKQSAYDAAYVIDPEAQATADALAELDEVKAQIAAMYADIAIGVSDVAFMKEMSEYIMNAKAYLVEKQALPEAVREKLVAKAESAAFEAAVDTVDALYEAYVDDGDSETVSVIDELYEDVTAEGIEVEKFAYTSQFGDFTVNTNTGNNLNSGSTQIAEKYISDSNKIVYEAYDNGTAFLMNFNDYRVVVTIADGKFAGTYTIDAYGYVVLSSAA